jgi:hypothetical protein
MEVVIVVKLFATVVAASSSSFRGDLSICIIADFDFLIVEPAGHKHGKGKVQTIVLFLCSVA